MSASSEWSVVLFTEENGRSPVREFLQGLDLRTQARLRRAVELLTQRNVHTGEPLVRHLEGKLWELRVESNTNIYRLVYFFHTGRRIVFLQRLPEEDAEDAAPGDRDRDQETGELSSERGGVTRI